MVSSCNCRATTQKLPHHWTHKAIQFIKTTAYTNTNIQRDGYSPLRTGGAESRGPVCPTLQASETIKKVNKAYESRKHRGNRFRVTGASCAPKQHLQRTLARDSSSAFSEIPPSCSCRIDTSCSGVFLRRPQKNDIFFVKANRYCATCATLGFD